MAMQRTMFSPKCCCDTLVLMFLMLFPLSDASCTYSHLEGQLVAAIVCGQGIENGGQLFGVELDCDKLSAPVLLLRYAMADIELRRDAAENFSIMTKCWNNFVQRT
jgi:hypothetical protein